MRKLIFTILVAVLLAPAICYAQNISDYLILQDIGLYKLEVRQKVIGGFIGGPRIFNGTGAIAPTDHFYVDHTDKTYEVYYEGGKSLNAPTVQVTQHSGGDSDKWLLHEVETSFRDRDNLEIGPDEDTMIRTINNNIIFFYGGGVRAGLAKLDRCISEEDAL